uniref:TLC domain-containing protein n=1 Tax=Anopheles dirus TaxID=7168 RepID=A0A182MXI7_9DIPT
MVEKINTRGCVFSLLYSIGSFALACASLSTLNPSDRISVQKGALLISLGFVYFVALTEFLNKLLLKTALGHNFVKRYRLRVSDVLDITNKLVSAVQAAFSCLAGLFVCRWSCPLNFLHASHFLSESYAWFAASYFFYDLWSMYKIYAAEAAIKLKAKLLGLQADNNNGDAANGAAKGAKAVAVAEQTHDALDDIPSVGRGTLSFVNPCKVGIPSFAKYLASHPLMVFHHLFIGSYGLVVISYLRGGLGDCVFSFMYMMELSTPFVSFRSILSVMGLKQTKLYVINGLVMLVTFFWCRVFLMPYVCYYYSQVVSKPFFEAVWNLPWGCKVSILALFLPQLYWFRLMVRGAVKAMKKSSYGMEEDDDDDDEEEGDEKGGESTDSDFDDDEDPDEIEVPGGGKDLATVATLTKKFKTEAASSSTSSNQLAALGMGATGNNTIDRQQQQQQLQQQPVQIKKITNFGINQAVKVPLPLAAAKPGVGGVGGGSSGLILTNTNRVAVMKPNVGSRMGLGGVGTMNTGTGTGGSEPAELDRARSGLKRLVPPTGTAATAPTTVTTAPSVIGTAPPGATSILGGLGSYYPPSLATLLAQMEMTGMGYAGNSSVGGGGSAPMGADSMNKIMTSQLMLQNLQAMLVANPHYLTSGIPTQLISQMVMADPSKLQLNQMPEEEEAEDEEMGVAETYAEYWPAKLKIGKKHPDPVVETASLSSVEPSDVYYQVSIPPETINAGLLSALQLESITYASQAHAHLLPDGTRAGFLIGDGAGVGKGRTIAGIIYENYLKGRKKSIWISVSNDLRYDAERDLRDIGAGKIEVLALNKLKYAKINSSVNHNVKKGVIFGTYSALIGESQSTAGKYKSRLKQLLQWCGPDFDGAIVFDECHKAKNLCPVGSSKPTKTGLTALELQNKLPKARVVYASATGASEPRNMAYMVRLGIWGQGTPFPSFLDFIQAVEKRGVGAMEIVAMDMKQRGMYIARQLSFHGVTFKIEEVPLTREFKQVYDASVELWVEAMQKFTEAAELIDAESRMKKTMWGQFWSAHQRFFKYLCIASKVNHAVKLAREAIKYGKCVVIGLQSTGEARTLEQLERDDGELSDFVSTAKGVMQSLVEKHFPAPDRNRINRLLGIATGDRRTQLSSILEDIARSKAANKAQEATRKRAVGAAVPTAKATGATKSKRPRNNGSSGDDDGGTSDASSNGSSPRRSNGSDFQASDSDLDDSEDDNNYDSAASQSDEYNPFFSGSDSDDDPWVSGKTKSSSSSRAKVKAKSKSTSSSTTAASTATASPVAAAAGAAGVASKKKPASTQDKIQAHLTKKQTEPTKPTTIQSSNGFSIQLAGGPPPKDAIERACEMKDELLGKIERLGDRLPANTLDQLIDELGGPDNVAEMTGRKGRVVQNDDGSIQYESRSEQDVPLETLNITEKQRFMDGTKDVAIISEAASSGISLQSDRRVRNQRRRVHITLELPWSADRAIQQFGRTHRSNQVNAPEYMFLISDLAGERRFASTVAKRLESLGALTHGDRRATETRDLSQFNIDNKYGRTALESVMKTIMGYEAPIVPPPADYRGDFFKDVAGALVGVGLIVNSEQMPGVLSLDKDYNNISKFLNRILGMPVELQNRLFKYFTDTLEATIEQAKKRGRFDLGILDLGAAGENVTRIKLIRFARKHSTGIAPTELHVVKVERGMIWQEAIDKWAELGGEKEGFYVSQHPRNGKYNVILAIEIENPNAKKKTLAAGDVKGKKDATLFQIYHPNMGLQFKHESLAELEKKYKKVLSTEAEPHWTKLYDASINTCSHSYWRGQCRNVTLGHECEVGLRRRTYSVLSGSVLAVWARVENSLAARIGNQSRLQVIRLKTKEGVKIVGTLIPKNCVEQLVKDLASDSEKVDEVIFDDQ